MATIDGDIHVWAFRSFLVVVRYQYTNCLKIVSLYIWHFSVGGGTDISGSTESARKATGLKNASNPAHPICIPATKRIATYSQESTGCWWYLSSYLVLLNPLLKLRLVASAAPLNRSGRISIQQTASPNKRSNVNTHNDHPAGCSRAGFSQGEYSPCGERTAHHSTQE
jgi:hypothetical protein